jgi:3-hydroxyisobutyrate dehydrogenase
MCASQSSARLRCLQNVRMTTPVVAVLGTGVMGAGMVRSLRRADIPVRMWNRNQDRLHALTDSGAQACGTPAEAAAGADVVLTMVFDADAAIEVIRQADAPAGTVWLQCTTVGVDGVERTIEVARELGLVLVDCPVLGTRAPAENGKLVMLASGPDDARDRLEPVLDACGSKTLWLGEAGQGSRLKLACNAWVLMYTAGIAQSVALTRGLGIDPEHFFAALEGGPLDAPYTRAKGPLMVQEDFPVSFDLNGAMKDARLIQAALRSAGIPDRLDAAVLETMQAAVDRVPDPGAVDMSAMILGLHPDRPR